MALIPQVHTNGAKLIALNCDPPAKKRQSSVTHSRLGFMPDPALNADVGRLIHTLIRHGDWSSRPRAPRTRTVVQDNKPLLIAAARLVADPDHDGADYGILVADAFQHRGLGRLLTEKCIEISRRWRLKRIAGETTTDNTAMIRIFCNLGFQVEFHASTQTVLARLNLQP
jgi:ribosomal protein S18 acetylase RimI-like enzyme